MYQFITNKRKITLQERIEIVSYCLKQQRNYQLIAKAYQVSYQQVCQWVKKLEANSEEALRDKRGGTKAEIELTPDKKIEVRNEMIKRLKPNRI
ncbi:helix-turn-helix domain-containing protein [Lysinibacillus sp. NPDC048646]|uniref:helix-turn-helix domain-containing protein n=1 Tax=Lysinibacillus sp. NPDC048646 TaxID=3390574 RepID=UPI003D0774E1